MAYSDRKSRGELLSTAEVQWSTTKLDGMCIFQVPITLDYRYQPAVRAPQVCLKKSAHCSWRAKLGEEASCLRRPVCGCYWLIVCLHSWLLSALILFRAEYRPYGGRSFRDLRSSFGYTPSESRSPPHTGHRIPTRGT